MRIAGAKRRYLFSQRSNVRLELIFRVRPRRRETRKIFARHQCGISLSRYSRAIGAPIGGPVFHDSSSMRRGPEFAFDFASQDDAWLRSSLEKFGATYLGARQ